MRKVLITGSIDDRDISCIKTMLELLSKSPETVCVHQIVSLVLYRRLSSAYIQPEGNGRVLDERLAEYQR